MKKITSFLIAAAMVTALIAAEVPAAANEEIDALAAEAVAAYEAPEGYEWPELKLTVNDYNVPGSGPALATQLACNFIEGVTDGKIKCDLYLGGTLVEATDSFASCAEGLCDITFYLYTLNSGVSTIHQLFTIFFTREMPNMVGMLKIMNDTIDTVPEFRQEFIDQNLYEIVACPTGSSRLQFNSKDLCESIKTPDDLKGHIVQSDGYNTTAWANHGVSGIAMPPSEWYSNLDRGVVDALSMNMPGCKDFGLFDVTNGYLEFGNNGGLLQSADGYFANLDKWNEWDPEVQDLISAAFALGVKFNCERDDVATVENTESEKAAGKYFNTIAEEDMQPWYDMGKESTELWKADLNAQGIDADAVYDGYMAAIDKWFEDNK